MPRSNDQNATAYPKAGVVTYFPSLRGGNLNPGRGEGFLGEVDDIIAAGLHEYLDRLQTDMNTVGAHISNAFFSAGADTAPRPSTSTTSVSRAD